MSLLALNSRRTHAVLMGRKSARRTQAIRTETARQRTRQVYVPSARVPGARDQVTKVVDTVEQMWRSQQMGDRPYEAAQMFRSAWDVIESVVGNAMDFDRVRGGGAPGQPYADQYLAAS